MIEAGLNDNDSSMQIYSLQFEFSFLIKILISFDFKVINVFFNSFSDDLNLQGLLPGIPVCVKSLCCNYML